MRFTKVAETVWYPCQVIRPTPELDRLCVNSIRALAIDAVQAASSGHPGMPLGAAPMGHALWSRHLRFNPRNPKWLNRDRFVLSAGHGSMLLYALLHLSGYALPLDELKRFRQFHSMTPGHPENFLTPGVEMATGPLGQGFATAVGMAMAERYLAAVFNRPDHALIDHYTYVICSDGDLMEGITNEAASLAGHQKLGKLIALWDDNHITIDGSTDLAFTEDVLARFAALGWHVDRAEDGMDVESVSAAIERAKTHSDRPSLVACRTTIGYGSPNKAGSSKSHGAALGEEEVRLTKQALGIPADAAFWIAPEAAEFYAQFASQGEHLEDTWMRQAEAYRYAFPEMAPRLDAAIAGAMPELNWGLLPSFDAAAQTRQASSKTLHALAASWPDLLGGSADLAESNLVHLPDTQTMSADAPAGRNIPFGVREHAMAAAVNGMNLHGGVRAFGATFLIFSDYCRPSIRLAALMRCPSIFVFTHDSIGVGEDGPTHQPIEHLASLRAIPNLDVLRPADGNETAVCWALALERSDGPSLLALTRQPVPSVAPPPSPDHPARRGAYALAESAGEPEVILVATGSEVGVAMGARDLLEKQGVRVRVVSMPSWKRFEAQDEAYRAALLPKDVLKISIEAGATMGWARYADVHVGLDRFGESAPYAKLMEAFGFTPEHVTDVALRHLPARTGSRA